MEKVVFLGYIVSKKMYKDGWGKYEDYSRMVHV